MKWPVNPDHAEYARRLGVVEIPQELEITDAEYRRHSEAWRRTHPHATTDEMHKRILGHALWARHAAVTAPKPAAVSAAPSIHVIKSHRWELRLIAGLLLLILLLLLSGRAHAQFSHITYIQTQQGGSDIAFHTSPFTLNFTGCTVTTSAGVDTINCNTGSVTNNPAGANYELQTYNGGAFGYVPEVGLGKVLIDQGPGNAPAFADPLVQGTQAAGSSTAVNPVLGGVWDGTYLRSFSGDSSGRLNVNINTGTVSISGTVPVSGTFWQATQPVSIASMPSTPVTGTFWQTTQPVSGTFWQATQPVSIATMPSTPVTGTFWQATQPVSGTFWQSTQPVSSTQLPAALDGSGYLKVNCESGCSGGGSTTPSDAFANPTTAGLQMTFPTLWNGSNWDRWYGDKNNGAWVNIKSSATLPVSWSAQTVTVTQTTGSNLHVQVDAAPSTAVTNAGTFAVQVNDGAGHSMPAGDASARSIHVTPDSAPTTAVTNTGLTDLDSTVGTPGSAVPSKSQQVSGTDGTNAIVPYVDPCQRGAKTYTPISQAATALATIVAGTSSKKTYVCSVLIVAAAANNVDIVEGTGTNCGTTVSAGLFGGSGAGTGPNLAANGGFALGNGTSAVAVTATAADNICLRLSAASQVSGNIVTVQY